MAKRGPMGKGLNCNQYIIRPCMHTLVSHRECQNVVRTLTTFETCIYYEVLVAILIKLPWYRVIK